MFRSASANATESSMPRPRNIPVSNDAWTGTVTYSLRTPSTPVSSLESSDAPCDRRWTGAASEIVLPIHDGPSGTRARIVRPRSKTVTVVPGGRRRPAAIAWNWSRPIDAATMRASPSRRRRGNASVSAGFAGRRAELVAADRRRLRLKRAFEPGDDAWRRRHRRSTGVPAQKSDPCASATPRLKYSWMIAKDSRRGRRSTRPRRRTSSGGRSPSVASRRCGALEHPRHLARGEPREAKRVRQASRALLPAFLTWLKTTATMAGATAMRAIRTIRVRRRAENAFIRGLDGAVRGPRRSEIGRPSIFCTRRRGPGVQSSSFSG